MDWEDLGVHQSTYPGTVCLDSVSECAGLPDPKARKETMDLMDIEKRSQRVFGRLEWGKENLGGCGELQSSKT